MSRIDHIVTSGTFSLNGETHDVDNNVWIVGDDAECIVIDAAHDAAAILTAIGDRTLVAVVCTHGHDDHIDAARAVAEETGAPVWLHLADRMLWDMHYTDGFAPSAALTDGQIIEVGGVSLTVLHTPGHSPGACCLYDADGRVVYAGDTLFHGGPGATGRSFSDFPTIIESIKTRLLTLPEDTAVCTGHGDTTRIGDEAPNLDAWIARGH